MNYPYANGTIAVIESNILDKNKLSKLFKKEKDDLIKALSEGGYGEGFTENLEDMIVAEMRKAKKRLDEISPVKRHTDLFFFANDAMNLKALYKIRIFGISHLDVTDDNGFIPLDDLKKAVFEGDFKNLSRSLAQLFKEINTRINGLDNPRLISATIDNCLFQYLFRNLLRHPSVALKTYFQAFVDFANVMTFIRSKNLKWNIDQFSEMFIDGGLLSKQLFTTVYELTNDDILRTFNDYYQGSISEGLKTYFEKRELTALEHHLDQAMIDVMEVYRNDSFAIGPIMYYFLKKQAEAKNIRLIYANPDIDASALLDY
jgi:V/A-type H+-transporting ATPase subunit C